MFEPLIGMTSSGSIQLPSLSISSLVVGLNGGRKLSQPVSLCFVGDLSRVWSSTSMLNPDLVPEDVNQAQVKMHESGTTPGCKHQSAPDKHRD